MPFTVTPEALKQADKCPNAFSCLNDSEYPVCGVFGEPTTGVLVTFCPQNSPCPYCQSKGIQGFCVCPVRIELHKKYGI